MGERPTWLSLQAEAIGAEIVLRFRSSVAVGERQVMAELTRTQVSLSSGSLAVANGRLMSQPGPTKTLICEFSNRRFTTQSGSPAHEIECPDCYGNHHSADRCKLGFNPINPGVLN